MKIVTCYAPELHKKMINFNPTVDKINWTGSFNKKKKKINCTANL